MKIAILGAGAMGCLYGSYLGKENQVTMVDVGQVVVDAINQHGLTMVEGEKEIVTSGIHAALSGSDIGAQELVIIFVKSTQTLQAMKENAHLFGGHTYVLTLQNGAGNNTDIAHFVDPSRIIVGTSSHNSVTLAPGKFFHSGSGPTNIGPNVASKESEVIVHTIAEVFRRVGLEVNESENIRRIIWTKLFVNCAINGLTCVIDSPIGELRENPYLWDLSRKIIYECVLVAEADGEYFDRKEEAEMVWSVIAKTASGTASMVQDRHHKRLTEIDKINGTIVSLGEKYHIDTPYNRMLVSLVHCVESHYPRT